jgi:hypothetical protein
MRFLLSTVFCLVVSFVVAASAPPHQTTALTPELKARILEAMRLNRRAFQAPDILARYGEERPPTDHPVFTSCDLPRTSEGEPASQYPAPQARTTARSYSEAAIVDCLETRGGLAGTRAKPLTQHYYCSLPGLSPDIRACFTFQLRLPKVSRTRHINDDQGYMPNGTRTRLKKGWDFLGPDPDQVPDVGAAFQYCATDGRPHSIESRRGNHKVETIHPTPTRPMCWIVETQAEIFQGIMSGKIDPALNEQVALLKEYYECDKIKGKVSARRFKALCEIDVKDFQ